MAYDKLGSKYVISYDMINSIVQDQTPRYLANIISLKQIHNGLKVFKEGMLSKKITHQLWGDKKLIFNSDRLSAEALDEKKKSN